MTTANKEFHAKNGLRVGANNGVQVVDANGNWTGQPIPSNLIQGTTVGVSTGGTGVTTFTAGYLKSPGGTSNITSVSSIPGADVSGNIAGNAGGLTSTLATTYGGTGLSTYTLGDLIYSSGPNALSKLAGNITTSLKFLSQTGSGTTSAAPTWTVVDKSTIGLANVENTALSTWVGSSNVTTLGNITTGTWNGTTLSIAKGGTGATSAIAALDNLLPRSSGTAWVLKSDGIGSYYFAQELGAQTISGTTLTTNKATTIATAGQTSFATPTAFEIGKGQVRVFRNGIRDTGFTEPNTTSILLTQPAVVNDEIFIEIDKAVTYDFQAAVCSFAPTGNIAATSVQNAIAELDTEKQAVISITDDTTTNATMYPMFVTGTSSTTARKLSTTKLSFNPSTGLLTATGFSGPLTGNASSATYATNTSITDDTTTNATMYPTFVSASTGNIGQKTSSSKLTFNPSSGVLSATSCNSLSDARLKKNVLSIDNGLSIINSINAVSFDWIESGKKSYGVIAQELEKVLPELIENGEFKTVNYSGLIGFLVQAVQELDSRVKDLEAK